MSGPEPKQTWAVGKGGTLQLLAPFLTTVRVEPGHLIARSTWARDRSTAALTDLAGAPVIARSNARDEDSLNVSNAGRYESIILNGSPSAAAIADAVNRLMDSYQPAHADDAVFLQRYVHDVSATAVVTTRVPGTAAPYTILALDPDPSGTDGVTSGTGQIVTWHILHVNPSQPCTTLCREKASSSHLQAFVGAVAEVNEAVATLAGAPQPLDMELLRDTTGDVHLLQVRPLVLPARATAPEGQQLASIAIAASRAADSEARQLLRSHGKLGLLSTTTDWNPAEMIGQRPHALASSLYAHAITNHTWARQRAEYGYQDLTGTTLMHLLAGQPYIDVRASLRSFIPATTPHGTAERLLAAQMRLLHSNRDLHRSVEFSVATSCADLALSRRLATGPAASLGVHERQELSEQLAVLTNAGLARLPHDIDAILSATQRRHQINQVTNPAERFNALQSEIANVAALPFAHIARAAFVATAFLRSSCEEGLANDDSVAAFMQGLDTISARMRRDGHRVHQGRLSWDEFTTTYGHLRPGTYDLRQRCYRDDPDTFLRPFVVPGPPSPAPRQGRQHWFTAKFFTVTARLQDLGLLASGEELVSFAKTAIRGRESAKFEYSAWISDLLESLYAARPTGVTRTELVHWTIPDAIRWCRDGVAPLPGTTEDRRKQHQMTTLIHLPATISATDDLTCFAEPPGTATYVGSQHIRAPACHNPSPESCVTGIVVVDQADPGCEWLFSRQVLGIVTAQGGVNSHLAVRCAELGIPAAIGVGEDKMRSLRDASYLSLDCRNKRVEAVR